MGCMGVPLNLRLSRDELNQHGNLTRRRIRMNDEATTSRILVKLGRNSRFWFADTIEEAR